MSHLKEFGDGVPLGEGGYGYVFSAKRKITDNLRVTRVLKWIPPSPRGAKAYEEAKTLQTLLHPYIVTYYSSWIETESSLSSEPFMREPLKTWKDVQAKNRGEFVDSRPDLSITASSSSSSDFGSKLKDGSEEGGEKDDPEVHLFLEMEFCEEGNLRHRIKSRNELYLDGQTLELMGVPRLPDLFKQIVRGVAYIHARRQMHRDLKPENIFISNSEIVKIGDFGLITKEAEELILTVPMKRWKDPSENTKGVGTDFYLSPEQRNKMKYSESVDVWAMGLVFFEVLYPRIKDQKERSDTLKLLSAEPQTFPSDFGLFANEYDHLVRRMLHPRADHRPTAEGVLEWLFHIPIVERQLGTARSGSMVPCSGLDTKIKDFLLPTEAPGFVVPIAVITGAYTELQISTVLETVRTTPSDILTNALVARLKDHLELGTGTKRNEIWLNGNSELNFLMDLERVFRRLDKEWMEEKGRILVQETGKSYPREKCRQILNCFENKAVIFVIHSAKPWLRFIDTYKEFICHVQRYKISSPRQRGVVIIMDQCEETKAEYRAFIDKWMTDPGCQEFYFEPAEPTGVITNPDRGLIERLLSNLPSCGVSHAAFWKCCDILSIERTETDGKTAAIVFPIKHGNFPGLSAIDLQTLWEGLVDKELTNVSLCNLRFELLYMSVWFVLEVCRVEKSINVEFDMEHLETLLNHLSESQLRYEAFLLCDEVKERFSHVPKVRLISDALGTVALCFQELLEPKAAGDKIIELMRGDLELDVLLKVFLAQTSLALSMIQSSESESNWEPVMKTLHSLEANREFTKDQHSDIRYYLFLVYLHLGHLKEVEAVYERIVEDGGNHMSTRQQFILVLHRLGRDDEALGLAEEVISRFGEWDRTKSIYQNVGIILASQGRHRLADNIFKQVWNHRVNVLGEFDDESISAFVDIATNQPFIGGDVHTCSNLLKEALLLQSKMLPEGCVRSWKTKVAYAQSLVVKGNTEQCQAALDLLLPIHNDKRFEAILNERDVTAMQILLTIGHAYFQLNDTVAAEGFTSRFATIQDKNGEMAHPLTVFSKHRLAEIWMRQGPTGIHKASELLGALLALEIEQTLNTTNTKKLLGLAHLAKSKLNEEEKPEELDKALAYFLDVFQMSATQDDDTLEAKASVVTLICKVYNEQGNATEYKHYLQTLFTILQARNEAKESGVFPIVANHNALQPTDPPSVDVKTVVDVLSRLKAVGLEESDFYSTPRSWE